MSDKTLHIHITNDPVYIENGYTMYLREGGPCWIIDPGLPPQGETIVQHVKEKSLQPAGILLTHGHADHIAGVDEVREGLGPVPVYLAREEWDALRNPMANLSSRMGTGLSTNVDDPLDLTPGATLELDGTTWQVIDVSGHSPGGRAVYCGELGVVFVGDALFAGSVGRVDFPHSSGDQLMRNIRENLLTLPDETRVLCGHGPETTVGRERETNPFIIYGL
jgi:glyoxylase-like metal-dependent hydrolase (beta-lactamase superfamily II)